MPLSGLHQTTQAAESETIASKKKTNHAVIFHTIMVVCFYALPQAKQALARN
jgi:hypothetical protein